MGSGWRVLSQAYVAVKGLFRNKGAVFWVIIFPILFYGLMVAIWGSPSYQPVKTGIVNLDPQQGDSGISASLIAAMNKSKLFKIKVYNNTTLMLQDLRHGKISAGLLIPANFSDNLESMRTAVVTVYYTKSPWSTYDKGVVQGFLSSFADNYRKEVLSVSMKYVPQYVPSNVTGFIEDWYKFIGTPISMKAIGYSPEMLATKQGLRAFYAIGMIGVEILFIGLSTGVASIIEMKKNGTLSLLLSSPMRAWEIFTSLTLEVLYAVGISAIAIWLTSILLGAQYHLSTGEALAIITLLLIGTIFTIGLGLLLAPLARSQEAAMAIVNGLAFPIMFIGGLVIPDFVLPPYLQGFAKYYPLSMTIKGIRDMTIYNATILGALRETTPAIIATIIVYLTGFIVFNKLLARAVEE